MIRCVDGTEVHKSIRCRSMPVREYDIFSATWSGQRMRPNEAAQDQKFGAFSATRLQLPENRYEISGEPLAPTQGKRARPPVVTSPPA